MTVLKGEFDERLYRIKSRVGWREFSQLSMQITSNVVEMQDLRRDLRDVEDQVVEVVDQMIYTGLINDILKNLVLQLK